LILLITLVERSQCFSKTFGDGTLFSAYAINDTHVLFNVTMTDLRYFAIGFGSSMSDIDMHVWFTNGASSACKDYYSTGETTPTLDSVQDLVSTIAVSGTSV
jgi:hypothetical protein